MRVLGIDSSTKVVGLGVVEDGRLLGETFLNTGRTHSERLVPMLMDLLAYADLTLEDMDALAVTIGPGSFTGLRIGLATVKGLALARQKPVVGVGTLEVLAANLAGWPGLVCPLLDARKNEVYTALYSWEKGRVHNHLEPAAMEPAALAELLAARQEPVTFLGDGVPVYREMLAAVLGERAHWAAEEHRLPRGALVARLGWERLQRGEKDDLGKLVPQYIRPSEAEVTWLKRQQECRTTGK